MNNEIFIREIKKRSIKPKNIYINLGLIFVVSLSVIILLFFFIKKRG